MLQPRVTKVRPTAKALQRRRHSPHPGAGLLCLTHRQGNGEVAVAKTTPASTLCTTGMRGWDCSLLHP